MKTCAVANCQRERAPDSLVCRDHLGQMWANRLDRSDAGYAPRQPEWLRRARLTPNGLARDFTDAA